MSPLLTCTTFARLVGRRRCRWQGALARPGAPGVSRVTEEEVLAELAAIESGAVTLTNETGSWGAVFCGNMTFRSSSGWTFVVFNDCDEWDYFDTIYTPDGRELVFDDIWPDRGEPKMRALLNYHPESAASLRAWGLAEATRPREAPPQERQA